MKILKIFLVLLITVFICSTPARSAELLSTVRITSSPAPLGSGARALGMGNAFIAMADDATAASWNPGGLTQLETPEMSVVWSNSHRTEGYFSSSHPEANGSNVTLSDDLNYLSAVYPFNLFGKNMVVSLNYQHLYGLDKNLDFDYRNSGEVAPGLNFDITQKINYSAGGGIKAMAPAYAIQLTEDLSLGATLNIWRDITGGRNGWREKYRSTGEGVFAGSPIILTSEQDEEFHNFRGINFNVGALWNVTDMITFGAVFKSPFTAKMDHYFRFQSSQTYPTLGTSITSAPFELRDTKEIHFPASYGAGLAFRLSDELTLACDAYRTEWGGYYSRSESGIKSSPIDGRPRSESHIGAATQVHLGVEYLTILENTIIPARGGFYWEPEPDEGNPENFYGVALGTGISLENLVLDFAYQYKWANGVGGNSIGIPNTTADVRQHKFYFSAIYYF